VRTIYHSWLLDELCTQFGEWAVDRIVAEYGFQTLKVPVSPTPYFVQRLGSEIAAFLVEHRGGQINEVPGRSAVKLKRDISARDWRIQTSTAPQIQLAKEYGISVRRIRQIKAARPDPRIT